MITTFCPNTELKHSNRHREAGTASREGRSHPGGDGLRLMGGGGGGALGAARTCQLSWCPKDGRDLGRDIKVGVNVL